MTKVMCDTNIICVERKNMPWLIIMLLGFTGLHWVLFLPAQPSIVMAAFVTIGLWILWKLKWVILGIIGLEEIFGGGGGNNT